MDTLQSTWEQEIHDNIEYTKKGSMFYCVEGGNESVGLYFTNEVEACHFNEKIQERLRKCRVRKSQQIKISDQKSGAVKDKPNSSESEVSSWRIWKKKEKKNGKPTLRKSLIGAPDENSLLHLQGGAKNNSPGESLGTLELRSFLMRTGLADWLTDSDKMKEVQKWAEENDLNGKLQSVKAEKRASKEKVPTGYGKRPPPPPPPLPPLSKTPTILPRKEASASSTLGSHETEKLSLDERMRRALDIIRDDMSSSSEEEDEYNTDSWDDEDNY